MLGLFFLDNWLLSYLHKHLLATLTHPQKEQLNIFVMDAHHIQSPSPINMLMWLLIKARYYKKEVVLINKSNINPTRKGISINDMTRIGRKIHKIGVEWECNLIDTINYPMVLYRMGQRDENNNWNSIELKNEMHIDTILKHDE